MSLVPFLAICFGAAGAALFLRRYRRLSLVIGLVGLAAGAIAAAIIVPGDRLTVGPGRIETTEFGRLFVVLGCSTGLVIAVVGLATSWERDLPVALLGGFGALGLALSVGDPIVALVAILAGALVGSLVTLVRPVTPANVQVASREFRAIAVAGALALIGMAWIARPLGALAEEPRVFGLAYVAVALGAAIRFGEIPFHRWAARLSDSAPEVALPLLLAWAPAGFAVVALAWMDRSIAPLLLPLEVERAIILAVGILSIVLGAAAAWLQEDLEHVVGYSIVQDAGFIILGLAILDPSAWQPTRNWVLVFVVAKTAFAAWAVAVRTRFGTRRIADLGGWARRSPGLGVAFVLIAAATIGLPGLVPWDVRGRLVDLSLTDGPVRLLVTLGGLASLLYYGRIAVAGVRGPSTLVAAGASERPRLPGRATDAGPVPPDVRAAARGVDRRLPASVGRLEARWTAGWSANRAPIASTGVLVLAVTAMAVAAGLLGGPVAAAAPAPEPAAPTETFVPGQTEPPSPDPSGTAEPSAEPSSTALPTP
jgi:NADH-quinone oxidoreductase subunit N